MGVSNKIQIQDAILEHLGYEQITDLSTVQELTVPELAEYACIIPEGESIRWRQDGVNPTASVGMPLAVGIPFWFNTNLGNLRFISQTPDDEGSMGSGSSPAILNVEYFRGK